MTALRFTALLTFALIASLAAGCLLVATIVGTFP